MKKIDLNADIAEGFPFDEALLKLLSSANIACGLHAGGAKEMQSAVRFAKENQVRIGAHPGFPDREKLWAYSNGFTRARISCTFTLSAWCLKSNL